MFNGKIHYKWPFSTAMLNNQIVSDPSIIITRKHHWTLPAVGGDVKPLRPGDQPAGHATAKHVVFPALGVDIDEIPGTAKGFFSQEVLHLVISYSYGKSIIMGKSSINGSCSKAMLNYQRLYHVISVFTVTQTFAAMFSGWFWGHVRPTVCELG